MRQGSWYTSLLDEFYLFGNILAADGAFSKFPGKRCCLICHHQLVFLSGFGWSTPLALPSTDDKHLKCCQAVAFKLKHCWVKQRSCRLGTVTVGMYEEAQCPNICYLLLQEQSTHLPRVLLHQGHVTLFVGPDEYVAHARPLVDGAGGAQVASAVVHAVPRPHLGGHFLRLVCVILN